NAGKTRQGVVKSIVTPGGTATIAVERVCADAMRHASRTCGSGKDSNSTDGRAAASADKRASTAQVWLLSPVGHERPVRRLNRRTIIAAGSRWSAVASVGR